MSPIGPPPIDRSPNHPAPQLTLTRAIWEEMRRHVEPLAPEEGCGLIAGQGGQAKLVLPVTNELHSPVRFRMAAEELLRAFMQIDKLGLELAAIYHSHPIGPGQPSTTDIDEAYYPDAVYLIWSPGTTGWACQGYNIRRGVVQGVTLHFTENE